jgi:hypothetical protein
MSVPQLDTDHCAHLGTGSGISEKRGFLDHQRFSWLCDRNNHAYDQIHVAFPITEPGEALVIEKATFFWQIWVFDRSWIAASAVQYNQI